MLEAKQLSKTYQGKEALKPTSFTVNKGDIFCLLGANGAGKTTTINLFLNFIQPSGGQALIGGKDVVKEPIETKKLLTYIPENLMLYPNLTGLENLEYFSGLANKKYQKEEFLKFLTEAGLQADAHDKRISTYSKGMRQKVGIALALASELLTKLSKKGVATLMATHDLFRAKETGTHIGMMREGSLVEQLTTDQINHTDLEKLYLKHMN